MAEAGPSRGSGSGGGDRSTQKHKFYKQQYRGRGNAGFRGDGRARGGRGRGRGGRPFHSGFDEDGQPKNNHLGRYREDPLSEVMCAPGISATAIQNKERSAERELVEYLERIADELYPETIEHVVKSEPDDGNADFEDMLNQELAGMSGDKKSNRFRLCRHDIPCVIYIEVLAPLDPTRLVTAILEQVEKSAKCPFRYLKRIVPIQDTCNATMTGLTQISPGIIQKGFATPDSHQLTFGIIPNSRNSERMDRMEMIQLVASQVSALNPEHKVDLKNPDRTILIEVNKNRLGMSVVQNYDRLKKYNPYQLAEALAQIQARQQSGNSAADPAEPAAEMTPRRSQAQIAHAKRDAKAIQMNIDNLAREKRKLPVNEFENVEEAGEIHDVEMGEVVEGKEGDKLKGDDWDEVIEGGRVMKMRRIEDQAGP